MMKPIFCILLALTAVLATAAEDRDPVLDTDGNKVISGDRYYIVPVVREEDEYFAQGGGGLSVSDRGEKPCPLEIIQESSKEKQGIPVIFTKKEHNVRYVSNEEPILIEMDIGEKTCGEKAYWRVGNPWDDKESSGLLLTTSESNWEKNSFTLVGTGNVYKFVKCFEDDLSGGDCSEVGIDLDKKGLRHLAINTFDPLVVKFKKVIKPKSLSI